MMLDLFDLPDAPQDTRRAAYEAIQPRSDLLQGKILSHMRQLHASGAIGTTPDECALSLGVDKLSVRPRFTELRAAGLICDSGYRCKNRGSGRSAKVWTVTERGAAQ